MPDDPDPTAARQRADHGDDAPHDGPAGSLDAGERVEEQADEPSEGTVAEPPTGEEPGPGPEADDPMAGSAPTG